MKNNVEKIIEQAKKLFEIKYSNNMFNCIEQAIEIVLGNKIVCELSNNFGITKREYALYIQEKMNGGKNV